MNLEASQYPIGRFTAKNDLKASELRAHIDELEVFPFRMRKEVEQELLKISEEEREVNEDFENPLDEEIEREIPSDADED